MGYWQEEWVKAYGKLHDRSLSVILLRIGINLVFIAGLFLVCSWIYERYQDSLYLITGAKIGLLSIIIRDALKQDGCINDLLVYFGNKILKKKVVIYRTENKVLQSKLGELEAMNLELSTKNIAIQERIKAMKDGDKNDTSARGVASYQKLLLFYMQKYDVGYSDPIWASQTARAMELEGIPLSDKTLRNIRAALIELDETRKYKP